MKYLTIAVFFVAVAACSAGLLAPAPALAAYAAPAPLAYAAPAPLAYAAPYAYAAPAAVREDAVIAGPSGTIASSRYGPAAYAYYG